MSLWNDELRKIFEDGQVTDSTRLPVEVHLIKKDDERHLIALVGGWPVSHSIYPADSNYLDVRAAFEYLKKNIFSLVFNAIGNLAVEAVKLPEAKDRAKAARIWAEDLGEYAKAQALQRQQHEMKRYSREAASFKPIIKDHQRRVDLIRRSLQAIAEIRREYKIKYRHRNPPRITKKAVAHLVYNKTHDLNSAASQYNREWSRTRIPFERLLAVKNVWDELTIEEKSDLNCPEVGINKEKKESSRKKIKTVN